MQSVSFLPAIFCGLVAYSMAWHHRDERENEMNDFHHVMHAQKEAQPSSDLVAASLSRAIHEHRLAPGTKLGEDELADIYSVSVSYTHLTLPTIYSV